MNSEDRISQLTDELVCHILSFLPTLHSFRTTVLSVNTIDMNYSKRDFGCSIFFPKIVDAVLSVHDLSIIQRIRLWTCGSRISYDLPTSCCFSSLKILSLFSFDLKARYIEKLVTDCCPVLEELDIWGVVGDVVSNFRISAPKLKRLTMSFDTIPTLSHVVINAPELEILYVAGCHIYCTLESPRFLDKAVIIDRYLSHIYADDSGYGATIMTKLLAGLGLSGVKELSIEVGFFETCIFPTAPALNALNKLELILNNIFSGEYVTQFLNRSPNIEYLALELKHKYLREELSFIPPEFVPVCLSSNLKVISMRGFIGRSSELELLRYLLQYGEVLNELTISCHPTLDCGKEESLYKEVLSFLRASRTCQVKFIKASSSASS